MLRALFFAVADALGGLYLLLVARRREGRRPEAVLVVGVLLLLAAGFLSWVSWRAGHPRVVIVRRPAPSGVGL